MEEGAIQPVVGNVFRLPQRQRGDKNDEGGTVRLTLTSVDGIETGA